MQSFSDADIEGIVASECQGHVGKERIVRHLTSATGMSLNEKRCTVLNVRSNGRLAVRMHHDNSEHSIRPQNLLPPENLPFGSYQPHNGPLIKEEDLRRYLNKAITHQAVTESINGRKDISRRVEISKEFIRGGPLTPSPCCDSQLSEEDQDPVTRLLTKVRPCCSGDGLVDLRKFNAGLVHNGEGDCSICLEALEEGGSGGRRSLSLPCGHSYHLSCCETWLSGHETCPSCRYDLGQPGSEYLDMFRSYEARVDVRVREFIISGMCERCQAVIHESNPLVFMPSGHGVTLVPRRSIVL
jgi:hypothetical protein